MRSTLVHGTLLTSKLDQSMLRCTVAFCLARLGSPTSNVSVALHSFRPTIQAPIHSARFARQQGSTSQPTYSHVITAKTAPLRACIDLCLTSFPAPLLSWCVLQTYPQCFDHAERIHLHGLDPARRTGHHVIFLSNFAASVSTERHTSAAYTINASSSSRTIAVERSLYKDAGLTALPRWSASHTASSSWPS
jgi:hypothetical protein